MFVSAFVCGYEEDVLAVLMAVFMAVEIAICFGTVLLSSAHCYNKMRC